MQSEWIELKFGVCEEYGNKHLEIYLKESSETSYYKYKYYSSNYCYIITVCTYLKWYQR